MVLVNADKETFEKFAKNNILEEILEIELKKRIKALGGSSMLTKKEFEMIECWFGWYISEQTVSDEELKEDYELLEKLRSMVTEE